MRGEFIGDAMSDAWEFLLYLLQQIRFQENTHDDYSFAQMFDMPLEGKWTCQDCGKVHMSQTKDDGSFQVGIGIDLGIKDPAPGLTLFEYLQYYFNLGFPMLCDSEQCAPKNKPGEFPDRARTKRLTSTPEVFFIHLKRFLTDNDDTSYMDKDGYTSDPESKQSNQRTR